METLFENIMAKIGELMGSYLPSLAGAIVILVLGWVLALIVSSLIRRFLIKTDLSKKLAGIGGSDIKAANIEKWTGRFFFWLIMIFVLVAFFQALGLTIITDPLNSFLILVFAYLPNLIAAALILLVAWILALVVRFLLLKALTLTKIDERLGELSAKKGAKVPVTQSIAAAAYWLIILLFLPAVLGTLKLSGLLDPVRGMIDKILGFLPNVFVAILIVLIGWFFARIIQRVVASLLAAVGVDTFSERIGFAPVLGKQKLSSVIGLLVYILILIPVFIAALNALNLVMITQPASNMLSIVLAAVPSIFAAVLLLAVAYLIGRWLTDLIANFLAGAGFDHMLVKIGVSEKLMGEGRSPSAITGVVILVVIMLLASVEALNLLGFNVLSQLLSKFILMIGHVALGLIIFAVGYYLAGLAARAISATGRSQAGLLATFARVAVILLAGAMALSEMGLATQIITIAFGLLLGAVAVAAAIAFGIGGKEAASRKIEEWMKSVESEEKTARKKKEV
jgi:hypothetical protein